MNINDGTIPAQSRAIALKRTSNGTSFTAVGTYVAESFEVTKPTQLAKRYDQANAPKGSVMTEDFMTGTATLQIATESPTTVPKVGDHFAETVFGTSTQFRLTEVGRVESIGALKTVRVTFKQRINAASL